MCRNIKVLRNAERPQPSRAHAEAFSQAVEDVTEATERLFEALA